MSILLAALVAGCSSDSDKSTPGGSDGPCVERNGSYLVTFDEHKGGTCGPIESGVTVLKASKGGSSPTCTGSQDLSADNCTLTNDLQCPDGYGGSHITGTVRWSEDGTRAEGTLGVDAAPGGGLSGCRSVYDVTWTRQ